MLAKPSFNLLQRTGATTWSAAHNLDEELMMTCLCWVLVYMRLEIWRKIGLSLWRLISAQRYALVVVYHWIGLDVQEQERKSQRSFLLANIRLSLAVK